ncbi:MAG TPA: outer membrane beta-barrel protein [Verrucomicrobia bacterium]|nr:outer membrane beta-barrel protein [Verrucomicrobiota bacterium]HOP95896.1 outer membrane beta-barrel protein [Verrucomicrobiota bacterium]
MKFNKWTLGLAAVGVVSLASAAQAEETANTVLTALSSTTLSGYVDTSLQWNFGSGNENTPPYSFGGPSKADGFNLNVVQISLEKPLDESEWAAGYRVDLWAGPDANRLFTQSIDASAEADFAIRQAYVNLRMPVRNGLDVKVGVFDTIIGYESVASPNNPNFTRSYGQTIEPQTHTGVLLSYRFNELVSVAAGVANTWGPVINSRAHGPNLDGNTKAESFKTYMASVAVTAPESWGFLAGSTVYGGIVSGFAEGPGENVTSYYAGTTLATPWNNLRLGAAWDYLDVHNIDFGPEDGVAWAAALYASFQATEKLSLHGRAEFLDDQAGVFYNPFGPLFGTGYRVWAFTATAQYDLWQNVLSRVELRWDHSDSSAKVFGGTDEPDAKNSWMLIGNIVYKF